MHAHDPDRRALLHRTAGVGLLAALGSMTSRTDAAPDPAPAPKDRERADRDFVLGAGMTEAEAECWARAAETAAAFFSLPELHPMDRQEVATAIHVVQNKLLGRPTYRTYLELAKAVHDGATP